MALSGAASAGGAAVGGAIVVNVFPDVTTEAFIDSNTSTHITQVDALGKIEVSAKSSIKEADPIKVPDHRHAAGVLLGRRGRRRPRAAAPPSAAR